MNELVPRGIDALEAPTALAVASAPAMHHAIGRVPASLGSPGHNVGPGDLQLMLLDLLPVGILIIDERRNMLLSNRVAEEIVASGNPLYSGNDGTVRVHDRAGQTAFVTFVRSMCSNSVNGGRHDMHIVLRKKGIPPVTVTATRCDNCPLTGKREGGQAQVLMCLRDPLRLRPPNEDTLRVLFGFTTAESGLANALVAGKTLREYAEQRGVGLNTVRTQLKAVLGKTGLHRQADLVRVLGAM